LDVLDFIKSYEQECIRSVICTDIEKDGMLQGASNELYQEIIESTSINLIASGGVSSIDDLHQLKTLKCEGVILGKAIYEGKISLKELRDLC
jgi:phosphoribosylformimino-5-aminoimidazole carboxamide ribotide isomerase